MSLDPERIGEEIIERGIYTAEGVLSDPVYELVTDSVPILCVDVVPVDMAANGTFRMGIIIRATGPEAGKPALLGGRVRKNERLDAAINRHLFGSFADGTFDFYPGNDEETPFHVGQYTHAPTSEGGYDPTKHSIAPTYLVSIPEPQIVRDEAKSFEWISSSEIPTTSAYNHHLALQKAATFLETT